MARSSQRLFERPEPPRRGLDLVRWTLFEYRGLEAFGETLSRWQILALYLRACPWILLLSAILYLSGTGLAVALELPLRFPDAFVSQWVDVFQAEQSLLARMVALLSMAVEASAAVLAVGLAVGLAGGLAGGLAFGLAGGLAVCLAVGLAFGLAFGLAGGLAGGLAWGLAGGLAGGLAFGLAGGLAFGLAGGLAWGLALGLAFGLAGGLAGGLAVGLAMVAGYTGGYLLGFYRLPFYAVEAAAALFCLDLRHNPYLHDDTVRLPIWRAHKRLADEASQDPETGIELAKFLLEHRPLQRRLAAELLHAAQAGRWALRPLEWEVLSRPPVVEDQPQFHAPQTWARGLDELRADLRAAGGETQISFKAEAWRAFCARLDAFRDQTLRVDPRWARYYLSALDAWQAEAAKERTRLEEEARLEEPVAPNVYRPGAPLRPGQDAALFLGREDLRRELSREIRTAPELPLLLVQGQRRVGKTSLLNFLPELLGAGFSVVYQDIQKGTVTSVPAWLEDLRRGVLQALELPPDGWQASDDWLSAWNALEAWLGEIAQRSERRLLLALDEYETLHRYLQRDPEQGDRLLGAIRSFTQHQTRVCLLLAGATPFTELRSPDWSKFFVQAVRLRVDYLKPPDAHRLITEPVPSLRYPAAVTERLYALTQGHPALLQLLCKALVDIANRDERADMTPSDLDEAIGRAIDRETPAMERFWAEFCTTLSCRACIEDILADREPANPRARSRLAEHGYIVQRDGRWRLRVPLFEDWLREYREGFDDPE